MAYQLLCAVNAAKMKKPTGQILLLAGGLLGILV